MERICFYRISMKISISCIVEVGFLVKLDYFLEDQLNIYIIEELYLLDMI